MTGEMVEVPVALLHHIDSQLSLGIHRERTSEDWRDEAENVVGIVRNLIEQAARSDRSEGAAE